MSRRLAWSLVSLAVLAAVAIRLRLLEVPLDRDEGEYAYVGQLLLQGVPPYGGAYTLKLPGIYGAYAASLALFGRTVAGVHLGLLVVSAATAVLVYGLVARLAGRATGVVASAAFAALAINPRLLGTAAYAEHFVLLPAVGGLLALLRATEARRPGWLVASGLLLGVALLMKQSGAFFAAGAVAYVLLGRSGSPPPAWPERIRAAGALLLAALGPFAAVCLLLLAAGTFGTFWFWTFAYAAEYAGATDLPTGLGNLRRALAAVAPSSSVLLALAAIGTAALARDADRRRRDFLLLLLAASVLATAAGLHFRQHYFLLMLPAVVTLAALGARAVAGLLAASRVRLLSAGLPAALAAIAVLQPVYASRAVLLELGPVQVSRAIYGRNPFPESIEIARYIRERTGQADRVAVVGSEPQIYFYAGRRSATGHIYTYPLMELHRYALAMQREMIREIEGANPKYLVFVSAPRSWLPKPQSDMTIFHWFEAYQRGFIRVGVVDLLPGREPVYAWDDEAARYTPRSDIWLAVYERRRSGR
jgi:4-amino-4-deoxy-L-arabinose transferase-like glycosyltransferase